MTKLCKDCDFYHDMFNGDPPIGQCRFGPPMLKQSNMDKWPTVRRDFWCGAFRERGKDEGDTE